MPQNLGRPHVGLVIDHPLRDLTTVAMTALALARRGCRASVLPLYEQGMDAPLLGLDAIVITFARPANRALVERYKALGLRVYVLDTEGGVLATDGPNTPDVLAATVRDEGWNTLLDGYFFWGPALRDAFAEAQAMEPARLHLTGCPRFDPVAPQWRGMLRYPDQGFILLNTAFPAVNSRFVENGEDRHAMLEAGWKPDYVDRMIADSHLVLSRMIELVRHVAARFPERRFLLRPHPFEAEETYRGAFRDLPNVVVNGEGSVLNAIAACSAVIQLNCSTAIEALMLDKLPLSPDFISTPLLREHSPLPNLASRQVGSMDELVRIIANLAEETAAFDFEERFDRLVSPYYFSRDGRAAERVAEVLADVRSSGRGISIRESLRSSHSRPSAAQRAQALAANLVGSRLASALRRRFQPNRRAKTLDSQALADTIAAAVAVSSGTMPRVRRHRHPWTGAPLSSLLIEPVPG